MYLAQSTNWGHFPDRIGIQKCWFFMRGENQSTRGKTSWSKDENQQQTQPAFDERLGIEPGPHWWEAGALTTVPSLLPQICILLMCQQILNEWTF